MRTSRSQPASRRATAGGRPGVVQAAALGLVLAMTATGAAARDLPGRLDPALDRLAGEHPEARAVAWVYFTDRAGAERDPAALAALRRTWPERSLRRRALRGVRRDLVVSDLPVHAPYVRALADLGVRVRGTSRWLDAASVEGPAERVAALARLPFVARVTPVPTAWPTPRDARAEPAPDVATAPLATRARGAAPEYVPGDPAYYGGAYGQLAMMQVPQMHALGLSGAGVLVCMIDTGYRTTHDIYAGLNVLATRDFIHGDTNVDFDPLQEDTAEVSHGTLTLACVAGSLPGVYSGGAFGATVALAKTEDIASETPVEMDYWQFAAEWADSLGADVISTSLGYSVFDAPWPSYTFADLDGRTTVVTLAAVEAAARGITVLTSAGNQGFGGITAPADADTVIAVGAVSSSNVVTSFSSRGPSADGRIKPDVTAMGLSVLTIPYRNDSSYILANGTSLACPLAAGVAALLLEAHPSWGPFEVREALRETALNHAAPNNNIGWGLIQGLDALNWVPSTVSAAKPAPTGLAFAAGPNPLRAGATATITLAAPGAGRVAVDVVDLAGRRIALLFEGAAATPVRVTWHGEGEGGRALPAGVYWIRLAAADGATARALRIVLLD